MSDSDKTKEALLEELQALCSRVAELERIEDEYKRAEAALRESEQRYAKAEQIAHFSHWERNLIEDEAVWSEESCRIFGVGPNKFQPSYKSFLDLIHPGDRERVKSALEAAPKEGKGFDIEYRIVRPDGAERILHSVAEVHFDKSGRAVKLVGTAHDVTERRQAEEGLRKAHHELERRVEERTADLAKTNTLLEEQIAEREQAEENIVRLNQCFLEFGADADKNISSVVETAGSILGGACALYNRLEGSLLCSIGEWQAPDDMPRETQAKGHLCYDVISGGQEPLIVTNLDKSPYAESDPNVKKYNLKTYIGCMVRVHNEPVGSLCVVHQEDKVLKPTEIEMLSILARAVGVEEERRKAEAVLCGSEERLRLALSAADMGTWRWDPVTNQDTRDASFNRILGLSAAESTQPVEDFLQRVHPDDRDMVNKEIQCTMRDRRPYLAEFRVVRPDGAIRWLRDQGKVLCDEDDRVSYMTGAVVDITERKKAEEKIVRAKEEWERTFMAVPDLIAIIDNDYRIVRVNKAMAKRMGVAPDEAAGMICYECVHQAKEPPAFCPHTKLLADGREHTEDVYEEHLGGHFIVSVSPLRDDDGSLVGCVHVARDITEHKKAEEALRESENKYRTLLENLPQKIFLKDRNSVFVSCNDNLARDFKIKSEEIAGKTDYDFLSKKLAEKYRADDKRIMESGGTEDIEESYIQDGREVLVHTVKTPVKDAQGNVIGILGIFRDITEQKKADEALRESEERYKALFEGAAEGILVAESETKRFKYANPAICEMLGYTGGELTRMGLRDIHPKDSLDHVISEFEAQAEREKALAPNIPCLRKDGTIMYADVNTALVVIDGRKCNVGFFTDITERKKAREALQRAHDELEARVEQRTAELAKAIEELQNEISERKSAQKQLRNLAFDLAEAEDKLRHRIATNVHDDISQNLAFSKMKLESLKVSTSSPECAASLEEICELVTQTIESSRMLTSELSPPVLYELGFEAAVEWLVRRTRQRDGIAAEFTTDGRPKPLSDRVGRVLFRAIQGLLVNVAKHAKARKVVVSTHKKGNEVQVTVEDDGIGFDAPKNGSGYYKTGGFGLFSIRERLSYIGGRLDVKSRPGHGTQVTVTVPIDREDQKSKGKRE